jgi:hypothetical protein
MWRICEYALVASKHWASSLRLGTLTGARPSTSQSPDSTKEHRTTGHAKVPKILIAASRKGGVRISFKSGLRRFESGASLTTRSTERQTQKFEYQTRKYNASIEKVPIICRFRSCTLGCRIGHRLNFTCDEIGQFFDCRSNSGLRTQPLSAHTRWRLNNRASEEPNAMDSPTKRGAGGADWWAYGAFENTQRYNA